jgi:hypothetical protein
VRCELALVAATLTAWASPAAAQAPLRDFATDRPDKTESPYTVDRGRFQIEADLANMTRDREDGVRATDLLLGAMNLKFGVAHRADVQVIVAPSVRRTVRNRATSARESASGVGDVTVRLKRNLWGDDGGRTAFALMPYVTLPTAADGLGADRAEFGLIAPLAVALSEDFSLGLMTEVDVVGRETGPGRVASFVNSATVGARVTERLGAYAELWTERSAERSSRWAATGDLGVTYLVADDFQLDAGANIGLTRAADDLNLFVGVSRRF